MNRTGPRIGILAFSLAVSAMGCAQAQENMAPSGDPHIGMYEGNYVTTGRPEYKAEGHVVAEGPGLYRMSVQFTTQGPEPKTHQLSLHGHAEGPRVRFYGMAQGTYWEGECQNHVLSVRRGEAGYGGVFTLNKYIAHSPTEGMAPPEGAVVLLPLVEGEKADLSAWQNTEWEALDNGVMQVKPGTGPNFTKEKFGDMTLHMEFNLPHMPTAFSQGRANSGVYIQNRYECQILDSFGMVPGVGDCGSIYAVAVTRVNACYPPGQWQTYDIEFRAPRFDSEGGVTEHARMTVRHNGVLIHENQVIENGTPGGIVDVFVEKDVIQLQDHGNPLRFRNIWVLPKE